MSVNELTDFLRAAQWRAVVVGAEQEEVLQRWGPPDDRSTGTAVILKYGTVEVTILDDKVTGIAIYFPQGGRNDPQKEAESDGPSLRSESEFWILLQEEHLTGDYVPSLCFDDQVAIRISESGVYAIFANGVLVSLQAYS
jgi:hypothetical protein